MSVLEIFEIIGQEKRNQTDYKLTLIVAKLRLMVLSSM